MTKDALKKKIKDIVEMAMSDGKGYANVSGAIETQINNALDEIDAAFNAALAAPEPEASPSSAEMVEKIRLGGYALNANDPDDRGPNGDDYHFTLSDSEAAALIDQRIKMVPRKMLSEIYNRGWNNGWESYAKPGISHNTENDVFSEFAAKYGYTVEKE